MAHIRLVAIDRPALVTALAARGMTVTSGERHGALSCDAMLFSLAGRDRAAPFMADPGYATMALVDADEQAMIAALDAGADDAVPVHASDAMIAARASALVRRRTRPPVLVVGGLTIDLLGRRATRDGRALDLLPREYRLLEVLARRVGETVPRATLLREVCGLGFDPGTNVLEVHVSRLRARLDHGFAAPMLLTDKRVGYRLVDPELAIAVAACDH